MLTSEGGVAGNTVDEGAEDAADTNTGAGEAHGGKTGSLHLGSGEDGRGRRLDNDAPGLHGRPHHGGSERVAGEAIASNSRLTHSREDGAGDASCGGEEINNAFREKREKSWTPVQRSGFHSPCDVDSMREGCLAPIRATAPVNLLEASIVADVFFDGADGLEEVNNWERLLDDGSKCSRSRKKRENGSGGWLSLVRGGALGATRRTGCRKR